MPESRQPTGGRAPGSRDTVRRAPDADGFSWHNPATMAIDADKALVLVDS